MRRATLLITLLILAPGCAVRTPPGPNRLDREITVRPLRAEDWPARGDAIAFGEGDRAPLPEHMEDLGQYGVGALYEFSDRSSAERNIAPEDTRFVLFASSAAEKDASAQETLRYTYFDDNGEPRSLVLEPGENGTFVTLWVPPEGEARGLFIYLGGLGGTTSPERSLIHTLYRRGWTVISATPPGDVFAKRTVEVTSGQPIDGVADSIARRMDSSLAERAYAVTAALELLREWRPDLPTRPRVVGGGSIGAVTLPAVVSTMRDEVDAAVLIGGGADLFGILRESPFGRKRFALSWLEPGPRDETGSVAWKPRAPTREELRELGRAVLDRSRLDPYHTAPSLGGIPVLQVHGQYDAIVPARSGDLLYERLGRPERWTYPVGHLGLFFLLHFEAGRIADWVEDTAAQ